MCMRLLLRRGYTVPVRTTSRRPKVSRTYEFAHKLTKHENCRGLRTSTANSKIKIRNSHQSDKAHVYRRSHAVEADLYGTAGACESAFDKASKESCAYKTEPV